MTGPVWPSPPWQYEHAALIFGVGLVTPFSTNLSVEAFLAQIADTPAVSIEKSCELTRAWFLEMGGTHYFAKWTDHRRYPELLQKDATICARSLHPAIVQMFWHVTTSDGVLLLFEKVKGMNLYLPPNRDRFFALPVATKLHVWTTLVEALTAIVEDGWTIVDFYEGNVIYDFEANVVKVFDFEFYHAGDGFSLEQDRMPGSDRSMAPEEFVRGAWIDQSTTVFNLGRFIIQALSSRDDGRWHAEFQGGPALASVLTRAIQLDRDRRFSTVREFMAAFVVAVAQDEAA